jgi:hypothetical protein
MASSPYAVLATARRRALVRDYKDQPPPIGIYAVRCPAAALLRLRASTNVQGALNRERFELRQGTHRDATLRQAWSLHGESAFQFQVIDVLKSREDDSASVIRDRLDELLALWREELRA